VIIRCDTSPRSRRCDCPAYIPDFFGPIPGQLYWDATNVVTSPAYSTSNSGANWNGPFSQYLYMKVAAVPEPSTCMMALAGLACGGYLVRHRRKRA
jgi:hypothetical protein